MIKFQHAEAEILGALEDTCLSSHLHLVWPNNLYPNLSTHNFTLHSPPEPSRLTRCMEKRSWTYNKEELDEHGRAMGHLGDTSRRLVNLSLRDDPFPFQITETTE
jgi:hypothetical protein